ncbi:MAG: hypothetical protein AAF999_04885 [Pseudomonadota bacterium]
MNRAPDHPARHPRKQNLHDMTDLAIDAKASITVRLVRHDRNWPVQALMLYGLVEKG